MLSYSPTTRVETPRDRFPLIGQNFYKLRERVAQYEERGQPAMPTWGADVVIVEAAGGSAVQLDAECDMAALAADLGYAVVVACRPGLGTLNHTLLTANHLR